MENTKPRETIPTACQTIHSVLIQPLAEALISCPSDVDDISIIVKQVDASLVRKVDRLGTCLLLSLKGWIIRPDN
jgi:hypothetical protein